MSEGEVTTLVARVGTPEDAVGVEWDGLQLAAMAAGGDLERPWQLDTQPDWELWEGLRVLSAAFEDGSALVCASLRPREAVGHGEDVIVAYLHRSDAEPAPLEDALISTQRGPDGQLERINVEASRGAEHAIVRAAGDYLVSGQEGDCERTVLLMRMAGSAGFGTFEVLRAP